MSLQISTGELLYSNLSPCLCQAKLCQTEYSKHWGIIDSLQYITEKTLNSNKIQIFIEQINWTWCAKEPDDWLFTMHHDSTGIKHI